jgi:alpha-D-xyloside xylohydrolase
MHSRAGFSSLARSSGSLMCAGGFVLKKWSAAFLLLFALFCTLELTSHAATGEVEKQMNGVVVRLPHGVLRVAVLSDTVFRIAYAPDAGFFSRQSIDVVPHESMTSGWETSSTSNEVTVKTAKVKVRVDRTNGRVRFEDAAGHPILSEAEGGRVMEPATVQGETTFHVQTQWNANAGESLYGLGQQQLGIVDIKGYDLELWQHNTNIALPFLVSSNGYGILWDNTSYSRFGDLREFEPIPAAQLFDREGKRGGLTVEPLDGSAAAKSGAEIEVNFKPSEGNWQPKSRRWEGTMEAPVSGDYQFQAYSNGGIKVWIDDRLVMNHWRQTWLTSQDQVKLHLEAGHRYPIKIETDGEQQTTLQFRWKTPSKSSATSMWSEVGDGVDYYFVYGPTPDEVIAGYRFLTGKATMMPSWAFGLWQSRQRYETSQQSLDVVNEFRRRKIPFDNIVQDWQYWRPDSWGSHEFDPTRFPNPNEWIKAIHDQHAHLMISVWGKFNPNTDNAKELQAKGYLYQPNVQEKIVDWIGFPYTFYDAFSEGARKLFWSQINAKLFSKGVDAWWMDATEPDLLPSPPTAEGQKTHMNPTAMGTGSRMLNGYPLMNSGAVYTGQRQAAPNQRVFILTRSGFAGQQRYSAASWSGDITSTWTAMAKQIPAGLGMSISGVPYWTMDAGGYTMQRRFGTKAPKPEDEEEWRELNTRWFEFATFCPLLRVHGEVRNREMWTLGDESSPAYQAELKFDRLRYRMFPYIYSLAGAVTQRDSTIMRPLVMDFPKDEQARELPNEYMFGPGFLVAPVTEYKQRERTVYLPQSAGWYDFWTGKAAKPGTTVTAAAPYDGIPIFVRAGSILPFGPDLQYVAEAPSDPMTLYVYAGADGKFTLYEDEGTTFDYEHGAFAEIPVEWKDSARTLRIGPRRGSFPGMLHARTFEIVLVTKDHASGFSFVPKPQRTLKYDGTAIDVALR